MRGRQLRDAINQHLRGLRVAQVGTDQDAAALNQDRGARMVPGQVASSLQSLSLTEAPQDLHDHPARHGHKQAHAARHAEDTRDGRDRCRQHPRLPADSHLRTPSESTARGSWR